MPAILSTKILEISQGPVWLTKKLPQALMNTALDQFAIPGDASFPLNQAFEAPKDRQDAETLRQYAMAQWIFSYWLQTLTCNRYLSQVRQELATRLLQRVYAGGNTPSKV